MSTGVSGKEPDMIPEFRNGYNKHLDLTEEEYWDQYFADYVDECESSARHEPTDTLEGEPYEDTYFHGIPDYDIFNRPAWGEEGE
jgi:hypothetical protein